MTQFLILHKVRGEPAFDVAEKLAIGDEEGWIIPTSGHRAYPHQTWPLEDLLETWPFMDEIPDGLPDHYQEVDLPAKKGMGRTDINIMAIVNNLLPKVHRRL